MSEPYSNNAQIFTFGVHGTNNTPDNVRDVTQRISQAVGRTTEGPNLWDNGFDWRARSETIETHTYDPVYGRIPVTTTVPVAGTSHQMNGTGDREIASERLAAHVLQQVDNAIESGRLDRDKPLTVNLVGFSHGGNVSILATDEISEGLRRRGIDSAIHVATLSTPAYTWGPENPDTARDLVQANGVKFAHTHFNTPGDGVIRAALANANYSTEVTRNYDFQQVPFGLNGLANHGAVQNVPAMMDGAAEIMRRRFNGLAPAQERSQVEDEIRVAGLAPVTTGGTTVDWAALSQNPLMRDASTALNRLAPEVPQENLNPNMVVATAGAAAQNGMRGIEEVTYGKDEQTAFAINRDPRNPDPAAHFARIDVAAANQPLEHLVDRYANVLQEAQAQQQPQHLVAQQHEQETVRQGPRV